VAYGRGFKIHGWMDALGLVIFINSRFLIEIEPVASDVFFNIITKILLASIFIYVAAGCLMILIGLIQRFIGLLIGYKITPQKIDDAYFESIRKWRYIELYMSTIFMIFESLRYFSFSLLFLISFYGVLLGIFMIFIPWTEYIRKN